MYQNANIILVILQLEIIQEKDHFYTRVLSKGMVFSLPLEESNL